MSGEKSGYNPDAYDDGTGLTAEEKAVLDKAAAERRSALFKKTDSESVVVQPPQSAIDKKHRLAASSDFRKKQAKKGVGRPEKIVDTDKNIEAALRRIKEILDMCKFLGEPKLEAANKRNPNGDQYVFRLLDNSEESVWGCRGNIDQIIDKLKTYLNGVIDGVSNV